MKLKTWMDAITDDSNLWLRATRAQDSGDNLGAFQLYHSDAMTCLGRGSLNRAALSCSCAADCLLSLGMTEEARIMYLESAHIYESNSDLTIGTSVRETLWTLSQSYDLFLFASDERRAERVYNKYISLARRTNPIDGETEAIKTLRTRKYETRLQNSDSPRNLSHPNSPDSEEQIRKRIEEFIRLRNKLETTRAARISYSPIEFQNERARRIEGSIVS